MSAGAPGVVVSVRDEGGTWTRSFGTGFLRTAEPPRRHGVVRVGSVTKSLTATVVLQLVADGLLSLDAPVSTYLPHLLPYRDPVTVRELLQHTSGLSDYGPVVWPSPRAEVQRRYRTYRPRQLVAIATREPLAFRPGSRFHYTNTDYVVLGLLVERATGHGFARELSRRVLGPAGMTDTRLAGAGARLSHPAMRGYEVLPGDHGRATDVTAFDMTVAWSSGGLVSTGRDLNRFYAALLDGTLLPPELLGQMRRTIPFQPGFGYGLGIATTDVCGRTLWGHVGGVPGYETWSFSDEALTRQITVTVNRSETLSAEAGQALLELVGAEFCG